jgi:hypothetical protein
MSESDPNAVPVPIQRRQHFRVRLCEDSLLRVRVWKLAPGTPLAAKPMPSQELKVQVREAGIGGLSVIVLGKEGQLPSVEMRERLRIEMQYGEEEALIEGRLRLPDVLPADDGSFMAGIQFITRLNDRAGFKAKARITAILGLLQREGLRFRSQAKPPP